MYLIVCTALRMRVAAFLNILPNPSPSHFVTTSFPLFNSPFSCSPSAGGSMCDKVYWPHHPESIVQTASLL